MRILITGGAGFVGSNLALLLKRDNADLELCAFDNLHRAGSELAVPRLRAAGIDFVHGDVRSAADLAGAGPFNLLLECSAEPSVHAGYDGSPLYAIDTNLMGTVHCLEAARMHRADVIFLSTSRVYPIDLLRSLPLERVGRRFELSENDSGTGWSFDGMTVDFPLSGARSLYGATKLASELLIEEYRTIYGLRTIVNRCGVIAGPWQMGKVDQGFVVLWAARHLFGQPLTYTGFGGDGLQVRDVLHIADLFALIKIELENLSRLSGRVFNVGGGRGGNVSLAELTELCRERAGRRIEMHRDPDTRPADVPFYISDNSAVSAATGWRPVRTLVDVLDDVFDWLAEHRLVLQPLLGAAGAPRLSHTH
jgi:CDP-paratose 2-epimerase